MKFKFLFCVTFCASFLFVNAQSIEHQVQLLDEYIQESINKWQPPGFAVTVVKDGEIIFKKGYGVRTIGTNNKVDENTLFGCMSTTKAFVAAGLAMLVDDRKLTWEDKVIDHLPNFQLKDPYLTRELNIRDLLTHRSGLGNTDYLWSVMTISSDSALYKMRDVDASYSIRSSFIYQNLMYLAAGKVIESVTGMTWGDFLKKRIYDPLDMTNTYPLLAMIEGIENKADAHYIIDDEITKIEQMSADVIGPAGSMWSSITDIGKWVQFLLNEGRVANDTLIKPASFKELFKPHQIVPSQEFYPTQQITKPNWMTYGLGWFQHDYNGKMVQFHTGSLPGMVAIVGMIPEDNIGLYVMGNLDHVELRHAIMYSVFDIFTDGKLSKNWSDEFYELYHPETDDPEETKPIEGTSPSIDQNELVGNFHNDQLGWVKISNESDQLQFNMNNTVYAELTHWQYNTYKAIFHKRYWGESMLTFRLNANGKLSYLEFFGERFDIEN